MFTFTRFFLAASMPLRIAMGTSRAFPAPYPTCPPASPTTTRAEKLMFLPPLTTLVTRLIDTTWSFSCNAFGSIRLATKPPRDSSELEAALARRIGQSFHRSEERRVGKECRCRWSPEHEKTKKGIRSEQNHQMAQLTTETNSVNSED